MKRNISTDSWYRLVFSFCSSKNPGAKIIIKRGANKIPNKVTSNKIPPRVPDVLSINSLVSSSVLFSS